MKRIEKLYNELSVKDRERLFEIATDICPSLFGMYDNSFEEMPCSQKGCVNCWFEEVEE